MTPDLLREVGETLYGAAWQAPLAAELDVAERTLRAWLSGKSPIPDGVRTELRGIVAARAGKLTGLISRLQ